MRENGFWKKIFILLGFMGIFSFLWGLIMSLIDLCSPSLAGIPHHISGATWFQLISSWLLALPSIGICSYALIQTKKYHDLDEERLRPELLMESAEISMCMVNWTDFDRWTHSKDGIGVLQQEEYQRYRKMHERKKANNKKSNIDNLGYLEFKSNLILKGGDSVSQITVQQITIQIGERQYVMKFADIVEAGQSEREVGAHIFFSRGYKNGQEEYHIEWHPDYRDIILKEYERESQKQSAESARQEPDEFYDRMQENFWNDMYNAIVDPEYDIARKDMEWQILMNIEYGINKTRRSKMPVDVDWRIRWNGENRERVNDYTASQLSKEGILSIG